MFRDINSIFYTQYISSFSDKHKNEPEISRDELDKIAIDFYKRLNSFFDIDTEPDGSGIILELKYDYVIQKEYDHTISRIIKELELYLSTSASIINLYRAGKHMLNSIVPYLKYVG